MPKRPDAQETLLLTLELLQRIPPRGTTTAARLQEELAGEGFVRELRTIQRLLDTLCNSDRYGIERDQSSKPYRYWRTHSRFALNLLGLSTKESLLLTLAEQQLSHLLPAKLMTSMDGFFAQARGQLADKGANELENQWLDKVRVVSTSQPLLPPTVNPEVFEQVSNALYANQWLEADYQNAEGKRASYKVMPLGLAQQGPRMYLVCRFDGHDNERCLALHRFISAKASTLTFERPKDFNLKQCGGLI